MPVLTVYPPNQQQLHPVKVWTDEIDPKTAEQLKLTATLPFIYRHVAGMPDVHLGIGATVGSVIATVNAIIPAAVGVDIGCGMNAVRLSLKGSQLPTNLKAVRHAIESVIPLGPGREHDDPQIKETSSLAKGLIEVMRANPNLEKMVRPGRWARQAGTLGGGNHFFRTMPG